MAADIGQLSDPIQNILKKNAPPPVPQFTPLPTPDSPEVAVKKKNEFMEKTPEFSDQKKLIKESSEFAEIQAKQKADETALMAQSKSIAANARADALAAPEIVEARKQLEKEMDKPFIPTADNAQELAAMFSVIGVLGFAFGVGGKGSAQQAMGAMSGMMDGYQKGRNDLYKKEKDQFETSLKQLKMKWDALDKDLQQIKDTAASRYDSALAQAELIATKHDADFVRQYARQYGLPKMLDFVNESVKRINTTYDDVLKHQQSVAEKNNQLKNQFDLKVWERESQIRQQRAAAEMKALGVGGKNRGSTQETNLRVLQQDIGNAAYNLDDLKNLAQESGKLPGGSVAFAQKFTGDLSSMILRYAANQSIDEGLQGSDALMLNLAFDIASGQSGGRGQLSDSKVRAIVSQMPLDEQPEATKATKWAALMTRVNEMNKSLPEDKQVQIPDDLERYYMGSRYKEPTSTPAAQERTATLNNRTIVVRDGKWVYKDTGEEAK